MIMSDNSQNPPQNSNSNPNPNSNLNQNPNQRPYKNQNPFKISSQMNDAINQNDGTNLYKPRAHQRSHSYNNYANQKPGHWQQLIPPMPNQNQKQTQTPQTQNQRPQNEMDLNFDFDLNFNNDMMNTNNDHTNQQISPQQFNQQQQQQQYQQFKQFQKSPQQYSQPYSQLSPHESQKLRANRHSMPSGSPSPINTGPNSPDNYGNTKEYPFHQTNSFAVRNNHDLPPFLRSQLNNQPKVRSSSSIKRPSQSQNQVQQSKDLSNVSTQPGQHPQPGQPSQPAPQATQSMSYSTQNAPAPVQSTQAPETKALRPPTDRPVLTNSDSSNSSLGTLGTPFQLSQKKSIRKKRKSCKKCGLEINGQFVRALNASFHVQCFCCNECGKECSSKFFPYEIIDNDTGLKYQVALCEYDYFKKLNLICHNCNNALRGPYITALGNKYHLEHFKCNICQKVFESDESYYEHGSNIYCHYHYSKSFANHCEGCNSSIVKQFVELFRGGRTQQWHPECYMVNKFWNVLVKRDCVGLQPHLLVDEGSSTFDEKNLIFIEQAIENLVIKCWVTLSGFEELTASAISDMLLNACIGNQFNGLVSTGRLIAFVEILFNSVDYLVELASSTANTDAIGDISANTETDNDTTMEDFNGTVRINLKKEPRNLSGKIMSYLAILRKSNQVDLSGSGSLSSELLSVITGCAHYLKLLIRIGLQNSLKLNQIRGDCLASDNFLNRIKQFEKFQIIPDLKQSSTSSPKLTDDYVRLIQSQLSIPNNSTDLCFHCKKSIEKSCIKFKDKLRWHTKCFQCTGCHTQLPDLNAVSFDVNSNDIACLDCGGGDRTIGFEYVSDLDQLIYLLKIAYLRCKQVMALDYKNKAHTLKPNTTANIKANNEIKSNYSDTINDITRKRTKRQNQNLSSSIKKNARKSVIIDAPEPEKGIDSKVDDSNLNNSTLSGNDVVGRQDSVNSNNSFTTRDDTELFNRKKLTIQDEVPRNVSNNHLNRTSDLLKNEKSLTLDDIPRIVAAEQARDQRPNAFKHHNSLYQRQQPMSKMVGLNNVNGSNRVPISPSIAGNNQSAGFSNPSQPTVGTPGAEGPVKLKYYSELDKEEHFVLRHVAIEALSQLTNNRHTNMELSSLIQTKKSSNFWDKFKFHSSNDKTNGVFGVDLQDLTKKYGVDSDLGVGPSKLRIPIVVDDLISSLKTKDMSVEGIFRLNGNIKKLRDLTEQINNNPLKSPDFTNQTAVQLAALMKKWLRELPNPLLTFNLYDLWIETQKQQDPKTRKRMLKLVYCMLPRSHRNLVEVLLYFFNWVSSFAELDEENGSKMDIHNLATVISPNILYSKPDGTGDQPSDSYFLAIEVVNQLIEIHEELSYIPADLLEFFNHLEVGNGTTKEIMNRIDKVSKETPSFFVNYDIKDEFSDPSNQEVRSNTITKGLSSVSSEQHGETSST